LQTLKQFCLTIFLLMKQAWLFPRSIADAFKQKLGLAARKNAEAERLDRIRNPSKYLGK
jgi:hypothetical protein